jgi:hypothetical protein
MTTDKSNKKPRTFPTLKMCLATKWSLKGAKVHNLYQILSRHESYTSLAIFIYRTCSSRQVIRGGDDVRA